MWEPFDGITAWIDRTATFVPGQVLYVQLLLNPPGPEGSKGRWLSGAIRVACPTLFGVTRPYGSPVSPPVFLGRRTSTRQWSFSLARHCVERHAAVPMRPANYLVAMSSAGNVVLVTGGSSGLGKAICARLAANGHIVYGTSRKAQADGPHGVTALVMDLTDEASVSRAVEEVIHREGRIDVVVNNAGIGFQGPAEDTPPELAARVFDTNVLGAHRVCRAVLPHMRALHRGRIINISSVAANFGLPYRAFYSATKAALDRYSEALAIEVRGSGIDVVTVQPGEFKTNIAGSRLRPALISDAYKEGYEKAMSVLDGSLHYSRDPDELAQVVQRIIAARQPRTSYVVAQGVQKVSVLAKKFLPGRMFQRMVGKHYE